MIKLQQLIQQLQFYLKAANSKGHGTHSPFVFEFITEVLNDNRYFYAFEEIDLLKKELLRDKRKVSYYGKETSIASIMHTSLSTKYNQLLFRMVAFYKPSSILEIGGSLGITTAYLASPDKNTLVHTIYHNEQPVKISRQNLSKLSLYNTLFTAATELKEQLSKMKEHKYELIIINHPNWELEEIGIDLQSFIEDESIVIFTGINKNLDKKKVYHNIVERSIKTISIELFEIGIIFFRKDVLKKQCFAIRF